MKIKVTDSNLTRLWDALDQANGKATKHVARPGDIFALAAKAEQSLISSGLPVSERAGAQVVWHRAGASALAYRYKMARTYIILTRGTKDWFLTGVDRIAVHPKQADHYRISVSPAQRDRIIATALRTFEVCEQSASVTASAA